MACRFHAKRGSPLGSPLQQEAPSLWVTKTCDVGSTRPPTMINTSRNLWGGGMLTDEPSPRVAVSSRTSAPVQSVSIPPAPRTCHGIA